MVSSRNGDPQKPKYVYRQSSKQLGTYPDRSSGFTFIILSVLQNSYVDGGKVKEMMHCTRLMQTLMLSTCTFYGTPRVKVLNPHGNAKS